MNGCEFILTKKRGNESKGSRCSRNIHGDKYCFEHEKLIIRKENPDYKLTKKSDGARSARGVFQILPRELIIEIILYSRASNILRATCKYLRWLIKEYKLPRDTGWKGAIEHPENCTQSLILFLIDRKSPMEIDVALTSGSAYIRSYWDQRKETFIKREIISSPSLSSMKRIYEYKRRHDGTKFKDLFKYAIKRGKEKSAEYIADVLIDNGVSIQKINKSLIKLIKKDLKFESSIFRFIDYTKHFDNEEKEHLKFEIKNIIKDKKIIPKSIKTPYSDSDLEYKVLRWAHWVE